MVELDMEVKPVESGQGMKVGAHFLHALFGWDVDDNLVRGQI